MIELDSARAKELGFTSDRFDGWLWDEGDNVFISFIESKDEGKGNLRQLIQTIWDEGKTVKVPTPSTRMAMILARMGFRPTMIDWDDEPCEVWVKSP